jgi:hypothetical protein
MKKLSSYSILLLVFIFSCSKETELKSAVKLFSGTWRWNYTLNCGGGVENLTGNVVITESPQFDGELFIVIPSVGSFEASASGEPDSFFYFNYIDENSVSINFEGFLEAGVLNLSGDKSDEDPLINCTYSGTAEKQ